MRTHFKTIILLVTLSHAPLALAQEIYDYEFKFVPPAGLDCESFAAEVGQKFALATGLQVASSTCASMGAEEANLVVSYWAEKQVTLETAVLGIFPEDDISSVLGSVYRGVYPSISSCYEHVTEQRSRFEQKTGLTAVAAVCVRGFVGDYGMRIDGFGHAQKKFYNSGYDLEFSGVPDKKFAAALSDWLRQGGADVVMTARFGRYLAAMFYADADFHFFVHHVNGSGWFPTAAGECPSELASMQTIFHDLGVSDPRGTCLGDDDGSYSFMNFVFRGQTVEQAYKSLHGPAYKNYLACKDDKKRVMDLFAAQHIPVVGAICGIEQRAAENRFYRMTVISKNI